MRFPSGPRRPLIVAAVLAVASALTLAADVLAPGAATASIQTGSPTLDRILAEQHRLSPSAPGIAARVDAPGIRWTGAVGSRERDGGPLRVDDTFRIASVTKTFTAAAVLKLVDQHRLRLDEPVAGHLPGPYAELLRQGGYRADLITVRHLLTHTSGLYDYATDDGFVEAALTHLDRHWTPAEQVAWAMGHGGAYGAPGERFHYSDTGYVLLARIVEQVTGDSQAAAYRRLLCLDHLGLTSTWFETLEPAPRGAGARAHQYFVDAPSGMDVDTYAADPSFDLYGGGGLVSSVADLNRFYRALFDGRVISGSALHTMLTLTATGHDGDGAGMGIFPRVIAGAACWWHNGLWGAAVLYCPQHRLAVAVTTNAFTTDRTEPGAMTDAVALAAEAIRLLPGRREP
jgi:D-alanyl-D-alanine carboxypeptidase